MLVSCNLLEGSARRRRRSRIDARTVIDGLVRLGDIGIVAASGLLASQLRFAGVGQPDVVTAALLIGILFSGCIFSLLKVYDIECFTRLSYQLSRLISGWVVTVGAILAVLYFIKSSEDLSRLWVGYWLMAGCTGLVAWRVLLRHVILGMQARGHFRPNLVLIGHGKVMADCLARLEAGDQGPKIAAAFILDEVRLTLPDQCLHIRDVVELEAVIREFGVDQVILTIPLAHTGEILKLLQRLKHLPIEINLYPDIIGAGLPIFKLTRLINAPLMQLMRRPLDGWAYVLKTLTDWLLALVLLVFTAPVMGIAAVAIKLTSPGPILYRQLRYGFNREPIPVFKFRTMYAEHCDPYDAHVIRQATRDDPRVIPVGRVLRKTSIDELPQLLNVLRGEMSLVGPRPHAIAHDDHYSQLVDGYLRRQRVKPGITGWAQVNGYRGEIRTLDEMRRRIELDIAYIEEWSFWTDIKILLRSATIMFGCPNAH